MKNRKTVAGSNAILNLKIVGKFLRCIVFKISLDRYISIWVICPISSSPIATFYPGHFAEGAREHYVCLADEFRDEALSGRPNTEHSCLSPAQEKQAKVDSASDINMQEDQSHGNIDQHAPVSTTHRNRTGLHENELEVNVTERNYSQMRRSDPLDTEYNGIPPAHDEQSELSSTSRIDFPESQSHSNKDSQHFNTMKMKRKI